MHAALCCCRLICAIFKISQHEHFINILNQTEARWDVRERNQTKGRPDVNVVYICVACICVCVQGLSICVEHNVPTGSFTTVHLCCFLLTGVVSSDVYIKMKTLCLIVLFHASLQLQCDKTSITAHIGDELILTCKYDTYLYSKKYWCRGDSRTTCETLVDSESKTSKTHRTQIIDARRRGLVVRVTDLQIEDTGLYWVGIDKIYADIMTSVKVVITEVPVSTPRLQPLTSLVDRPTCRGQPVTVRCDCAKGTAVRYAWYQHTHRGDFLLHRSAHFHLHCGTVGTDSQYYCNASNAVSSQRSESLSVQVLRPADRSCIYVVHMRGQPLYDCADRLSTTTDITPPPTSCQATEKIHSDTRKLTNQTDEDLLSTRTWTGVPFWYTFLRWGCFASLLIFLCVFLTCAEVRHKRATRKR
ncbi:uncharacterized protein LOC115004475, partial [Cottoperca gobio]|uniref:Uncharacterized protein LOC115004475 n=1 Tax=Cottoperca gobio TaxID=56716 RepID=A0A6J2P8Y1_COTGO